MEISCKVKTGILEKKLNELNLEEMTPTEMEKIIREKIEVVLIAKRPNRGEVTEKTFHLDLKDNIGEWVMNLDNQYLIAIKTTKLEYERKLAVETDEKQKEIYQAMMTREQKRILATKNVLLDNLERGDE